MFGISIQLFLATSLPSRERGLKYAKHNHHFVDNLSLPSRERGLKLQVPLPLLPGCFVAPLAGAWIEILEWVTKQNTLSSLLSRERGLKYSMNNSAAIRTLSLPSRERGLKLTISFQITLINLVAPLAGAWIEIFKLNPSCAASSSRSPRGSVD